MKEKLAALWAKIVENKKTVIQTSGAVGGAILGVVVAMVVRNAMDEQSRYEAMDAEVARDILSDEIE